MTIINDDAVAAVAAPAGKKEKRKYKQREPIYESKFSFTDSNLVRVKFRNGFKRDRRFDDKITGLSLNITEYGKITFYAFKNVPMYNKKKNIWAPNVVYKKMFVWAKNTGFNCDAARNKVAGYLDQIVDSRSKTDDEITIEYLVKKFIKTGLNNFTLRDESRTYKPEVAKKYISSLKHYVLYEGCTEQTRIKHTAPIEYQNTIYTKPLKDIE